MKRRLYLLLVAGIVLLTGCGFPVKDISSSDENLNEQGITLDDQKQESEVIGGKEEEIKDEYAIQPEKPMMSITLYYQDADGYLIPVTRKVAKQEGIARAAVNGLIDSPLNREEIEYYGIYPVLPKGTKVLGLTIRDGTATIDFSNELLNYESEILEKSIVSSIVYTLTEFETVKNVKILVNGYSQGKMKFNTDISGLLNRDSILINSPKANLKQGMKKFDAYFFRNVNGKFSYMLPVSVEGSEIKSESLVQEIIERLVEGPGDENLFTEIPKGTKLLGQSVKNRIITLNFNDSIKNYGGNTREEGILNQILFSMKQLKEVTAVRIRINGKEDNLPEGTDLSEALKIPAEINNYLDR